jgi:hypothetical protein
VLGVVPAHQRLGPDHPAARQLDLGLVEQGSGGPVRGRAAAKPGAQDRQDVGGLHGLGGAVVEALQRLMEGDELARLGLRQRRLYLRPVRLAGWFAVAGWLVA